MDVNLERRIREFFDRKSQGPSIAPLSSHDGIDRSIAAWIEISGRNTPDGIIVWVDAFMERWNRSLMRVVK